MDINFLFLALPTIDPLKCRETEVRLMQTSSHCIFSRFVLLQDIDECFTEPCQHNATCVDLVGRFSCDCAPGYQGQFCEMEVNECESYPCLNGATCTNSPGSFRYVFSLTSICWFSELFEPPPIVFYVFPYFIYTRVEKTTALFINHLTLRCV